MQGTVRVLVLEYVFQVLAKFLVIHIFIYVCWQADDNTC